MAEPNIRPTPVPTTKEQIEFAYKFSESLYEEIQAFKSGSKVAAVVVTTEPVKGEYGFTKAQAESIITLVNSLRAAVIKTGIMKE